MGNNGNFTRASVSVVDIQHDLAVLELHGDLSIIDRESADGLEICSEYAGVGTEVAYAGFPLGDQLLDASQAPTYAQGVVGAQLREHTDRKHIQISGAVVGGFSGAPIVRKDAPNKVVGVLSNSPSKQAGDASIFMGVSWEHLKALVSLATS